MIPSLTFIADAFIIIQQTTLRTVALRGCTGFDGGLAVWEAIRGTGPRHQSVNLNINAEDRLAYAA